MSGPDHRPSSPETQGSAATLFVDDGQMSDPDVELRPLEHAERYELREVLGEGGMGEVRLCRDRHIGRDVALKVVRAHREGRRDVRARFLREARVQGQLEHPAIVPVYDLGRDPGGAVFFTMKRVRGATLDEILHGLRRGDPFFAEEYTRHRLLAAFSRVCLAVHFAHTRGVIHRDIKPANVMFGDFGEVYLLDWGLAKVAAASKDLDKESSTSGEPLELGAAGDAKTAAGVVLGTPAYMAPEQIDGLPIDHRVDVYALGAILFEIVTLLPMHGEGTPMQVLERVLRGVERRPSVRARKVDVPPELEAACVRATERAPEDRFASARELHDDVERYLAGDRDQAARRQAASVHVTEARAFAEVALRPSGTLDDRRNALREVGRALALDPVNPSALDVLVRLASAPAPTLPPEVQAELEASDAQSRSGALLRGVVTYTVPVVAFYLPMFYIMGFKPGGLVPGLAWMGSMFFAGAVAFAVLRRPSISRRVPLTALASTFALAMSSLVFGPFLFSPPVIALNTVMNVLATRREHRVFVTVVGAMACVLPFLVEATGLVPSTFGYREGELWMRSPVIRYEPGSTTLFFALVYLGMLTFVSIYAVRFREARGVAETRAAMSSWQLRQLVPEAARSATDGPGEAG
ncbi:MAG: serine/threonine protein kinase [Myxococcales bacterium]|nr:serine/threonine protein kinase [Myxococcales bacterium]